MVILQGPSFRFQTCLVDVSIKGARFSGTELPRILEDVLMTIGDVQTFGTVRWRKGNLCGIQFEKPLSAFEVARIRSEGRRGGHLPPEIKAACDDWTIGIAR